MLAQNGAKAAIASARAQRAGLAAAWPASLVLIPLATVIRSLLVFVIGFALTTSACELGGIGTAPSASPTASPTPTWRVLVGGDAALETRARLLEASGATVQLVPRPDARGAMAIADLVKEHAGDAKHLSIVSASIVAHELLANIAPRLSEATPVARLGSEAFILAVAPNSPLRDGTALRDRLEKDAGSLRFAGGAAIGSLEHQLAALVVRDVTHGANALVYAAYPTTADAISGVTAGQSSVVVGRYGALRDALEGGRLRGLAVSSGQRIPGVDLPTLRESKIDVLFVDWALLAAPPRIATKDLASLRDAVVRAHDDPAWSQAVREHRWVDDFATDGLTTFLGTESSRASTTLLALQLIKPR